MNANEREIRTWGYTALLKTLIRVRFRPFAANNVGAAAALAG
jgi:hypothetical protein